MSTVFICYLNILTFYVFLESYAALDLVSEYVSNRQIGSEQTFIDQNELELELKTPNTDANEPPPPPPSNCVQIQCKIVCIRERIDQIERSIENAISAANTTCAIIEELRLHSSMFPNRKISYGFLGKYSQLVRSLYIGSSAVTDIDAGAFANGKFEEIYLENLEVRELRKDIFQNVTNTFKSLVIIQRTKPVKAVCADFLGHVKNLITKLTLQLGLTAITNTTASSSLLNNLKHIDLSYNNFTNTFTDETFDKLWIVESLDLSHSNIEYLPNYIFSQFSSSLTYLNLSHNHLHTMNHLIFGRRQIYSDLVIDAHSNPWNCSCELLNEMSIILKYQSDHPICQTPAEYATLSVLDLAICPDEPESNTATLQTTSTKISGAYTIPTTSSRPATSTIVDPLTSHEHEVNSTTTLADTTTLTPSTTTTTTSDKIILLQCFCPGGKSTAEWQKVLWPETQIHLTELSKLRVAVSLEIPNAVKSYGLIWFSKVVDDYYKMTVNYNQYGLGCFGPIMQQTIIRDLLPDTTYTFCLFSTDRVKIPPFYCESLHVSSNVEVIYNAWLTHAMQPTGIALTVLGAVLCCFLGMAAVFMLIKHKPTLLLGSKRVKATNTTSQDIVIFPKQRSLEELKIKEETLAKRNSRNLEDANTNGQTIRRSSVISVESNQSYMNINLYEVIPAYLRLQEINNGNEKRSLDFESIDSYMPPLAPKYEYRDTSLVSYAELSPRSKRASNDPLPALPANQITPTYAVTEKKNSPPQDLEILANKVNNTRRENKEQLAG
ncbi:uncharacterized protein LOC118743053 [Rhagoletis pomonella]|uniref:uncharacterized protein LOC118743053 n=1 Tax=Rhagoletis pomonella TaxID=28610 RepID=UPI001786280E|nr:uncharacterized protein LOC118743053 [Rhagoletis pomonella]